VGNIQTELALVVEHQAQLKVEQKIMRQELRDELMQEVKRSLQDEISSRSLDSIPPVSAATSVSGGGVEVPAAASTLATKPATYDGKTTCTWDAYRAQFELLAGLNHWNDLQKAYYFGSESEGASSNVNCPYKSFKRRSSKLRGADHSSGESVWLCTSNRAEQGAA
jgi:ribosome modulation factor